MTSVKRRTAIRASGLLCLLGGRALGRLALVTTGVTGPVNWSRAATPGEVRVPLGALLFDGLTPKDGVSFYDRQGVLLWAFASLRPRATRMVMVGSPNFSLPEAVRVVWRDNPRTINNTTGRGGLDFDGTVLGEDTVEVAPRIPEEVLVYARKHPGTMRLKFRVYDEGLLVGWDVVKPPPSRPVPGVYYPAEYTLVGGDFQEAEIVAARAVRPGWYIDKKGARHDSDS